MQISNRMDKCCIFSQVILYSEKKKKRSLVWQSQSTYAEHLAIPNCHLPACSEGTCWKGSALSLVECALDWSVDRCDFSVIRDYTMFLEYSCFKNYNYSSQHDYGCTPPFCEHMFSFISSLPQRRCCQLWGLIMGWVTLRTSGKLVLWLHYGQT